MKVYCAVSDYVLLGGGGHAAVILDVLTRLGHRTLGYVAPTASARSLGVPWLGKDEVALANGWPGGTFAALGLGKIRIEGVRMRVLDAFNGSGLTFPEIVSPAATVQSHVILGQATVVLDGAVVATGSRLGRACIINTRSVVDHDSVLGVNVHVAPGATVCGSASIGDNCIIGAGATVIHSIAVCADVVIGAGATVVKDITEPGTYAGTPARKLR